MNTKLLSLIAFSAACAAGPVSAQPVMTATSPEATQAAAPAQAPQSRPNQKVYSQRLPSVNELSAAAAAQGLTVERIDQTASQVTAVYKNASGQTTTVAYLLLPGASVATSSQTYAPAPGATVAAPATPAPTVTYYEPAPRVVYYDDYPGYYYGYPRYYWGPPISIGLGFGFHGGGYHGGGYRGGFHGGFHH